jgi:hypothetical protein
VAVLSLISQSLRTAEPMHQVLPRSLLERLLIHSRTTEGTAATDTDQVNVIDFKEVQSVNYMYYASGLVAVYEVVRVRLITFYVLVCAADPRFLILIDDWRYGYDRGWTSCTGLLERFAGRSP